MSELEGREEEEALAALPGNLELPSTARERWLAERESYHTEMCELETVLVAIFIDRIGMPAGPRSGACGQLQPRKIARTGLPSKPERRRGSAINS